MLLSRVVVICWFVVVVTLLWYNERFDICCWYSVGCCYICWYVVLLIVYSVVDILVMLLHFVPFVLVDYVDDVRYYVECCCCCCSLPDIVGGVPYPLLWCVTVEFVVVLLLRGETVGTWCCCSLICYCSIDSWWYNCCIEYSIVMRNSWCISLYCYYGILWCYEVDLIPVVLIVVENVDGCDLLCWNAVHCYLLFLWFIGSIVVVLFIVLVFIEEMLLLLSILELLLLCYIVIIPLCLWWLIVDCCWCWCCIVAVVCCCCMIFCCITAFIVVVRCCWVLLHLTVCCCCYCYCSFDIVVIHSIIIVVVIRWLHC